jgi:ABC-type nitrate/sulfonate/bicarbonate transport system substrate-binding protein
MKSWCLILALAMATVAWAGCGGGEAATESSSPGTAAAETTAAETTPAQKPPTPQLVTMSLDDVVGPANVGVSMAEEKNFFDDEGLELSAGVPRWPRRPVRYVGRSTDELGITQLPQLIVAKENGAPIVAVGSLVPQATASLIWLPGSGITKIADLKGKTIGIPGVPFQKAFLSEVLKRSGLTVDDVKVENVAYQTVPFLLKGRVDAIFGGSWNIDGATLEAHGAKPVIKRVEDLGLPGWDELVVIARTDLVAEEPRMIRRFMAAVLRGGAAAVREPGTAAKVIVKDLEAQGASREETRRGLEATLPLLSRSGHMDRRQAAKLVSWMYDRGLIKRKLPVSELLTNRYLPAQP